MDLNHKPTDAKRCLPYSTSHPKQYLKIISFVMARRIFTLAENNSIQNKDSNEFQGILKPAAFLKGSLKLEYRKHLKSR